MEEGLIYCFEKISIELCPTRRLWFYSKVVRDDGYIHDPVGIDLLMHYKINYTVQVKIFITQQILKKNLN